MLLKNLAASAERRTCVWCALSVLALLFGLGCAGRFISLSEDDLHSFMREPFARLRVSSFSPFMIVFRSASTALYVAPSETAHLEPLMQALFLYGILPLVCVGLYDWLAITGVL